MKNKFHLQIDINSPSRKSLVKTPDILRKKDYSFISYSPNSIKHRISIIEVEVTKEINEKRKKSVKEEEKEEKEEKAEKEKYSHK